MWSAPAWAAEGPVDPGVPPAAAVEPDEDPHIAFRVAENTFRYQDYDRAVELLEKLLYPEVVLLEDDEIKAREYLGASHWWLKHFDRAQEEFTSLLTRRPEHRLDAFYYPAALIAFFDGVHEKLVRLKVIAPDGSAPPTVTPPAAREVVIEKHSLVLCFVPFGVGQFQNGDTAKGVVFLVTETLALATNIASYFIIDSLREDDGFIAPQNIDRARSFEIVLYASLGTLAALVVGGTVDALVFYEPQVESIRPLVPPPATEDDDAPKATWHIVPTVNDDGMGLGMALQF